MTNTQENTTILAIYPIDEGILAQKEGKSVHSNPYKAPNIPTTDNVKADSWLRGFYQRLRS